MASSSTASARPSSRLTFGRSSALLITVAAGVAVFLLNTFSHPAGPPFPGLVVSPLLGLASLICWSVVAKRSFTRRQLPVGLIVAPVVGALSIAVLYSGTTNSLRFNQIDRPAFDAVIAQTPPLPAWTEGDLINDEHNEAFPGPCPTFIGTMHIFKCESFTAGYLFYQDGTASSLDGGLAYLPAGVPPGYVGNGGFERPEFFPLAGPWYSFYSSW